MKKIILISILATSLFVVSQLEAGVWLIWGTADRDGYITWLSEEAECIGFQAQVVRADTNTKFGCEYSIVTEQWFYNRAFFSYDLSELSGTVDSAKVKLVIHSKSNTDWSPACSVFVGDCCIGTTCTGALVAADSSDCTSYLYDILWTAFPAAGDTLTFSIPVQYINLGNGHTLDIRLKAKKEADVCAATGVNVVRFHTTEATVTNNRPKLYVWTADPPPPSDAGITFCTFPNSRIQKGINQAAPKWRKLGLPRYGIHRIQQGN